MTRAVYLDFEAFTPTLKEASAAVAWENRRAQAHTLVASFLPDEGKPIQIIIWTRDELPQRFRDDPAQLIPKHCRKHAGKDAQIWLYHGVKAESGKLGRLACPPPLKLAALIDIPFVAHNAEYDARAWARLGWEWPQGGWFDTMHAARALSLPGKLDDLLELKFDQGKFKQPDAFPRYEALSNPARVQMVRYCVADTIPLRTLGVDLFAQLNDDQLDGIRCDFELNDRGVPISDALATGIHVLSESLQLQQYAEVEKLTSGSVTGKTLRSDKQLKKWFLDHGLAVFKVDPDTNKRKPSISADALQHARDGGDTDDYEWSTMDHHAMVCDVINARLATASINGHKASAALKYSCKDGRARDLVGANIAHTNRSAGRGLQPHNLTRGEAKPDVLRRALMVLMMLGQGECDTDAAQQGLIELVSIQNDAAKSKATKAGRPAPKTLTMDRLIASCLRPILWAPGENLLVCADISAVESRVALFMAGEEWALDVYRKGGDMYCRFGSDYLFGRTITKATDPDERQLSKVAVLGCGYQMGDARFAAQCVSDGVDLRALGFHPLDVIHAWRDAHPAIAGKCVGTFDTDDGLTRNVYKGGLWDALNNASIRVVNGGQSEFVGVGLEVEFEMHGADLHVNLPSGRPMIYIDAKVEQIVPKWGGKPRDTVTYMRRGGRVQMYGGKWLENIDQAICYDLLLEAWLDCEAWDLPIVLHVHDELVAEVHADVADEALTVMVDRMAQSPTWAPDLPLAAEGHAGTYFCKAPPDGWLTYESH